MNIGAFWCVFFNRVGLLNKFRYKSLKHAYRAPSLFLSKMRDSGHDLHSLSCDEELELTDFSTQRIHESADLFYLATHGVFAAGGYSACLNLTDWAPSSTGLGNKNTVVAIFDSCYLIDSAQNWRQIWSTATFGTTLRLMLGFDGLAGFDRGDALRGKAFADNLVKGQTFVDAWFAAVSATTPRYNQAIAIGIGDTQADAVQVLNNASLSSMPGPRTGASTHLELRP
jgi:hypothetical protein